MPFAINKISFVSLLTVHCADLSFKVSFNVFTDCFAKDNWQVFFYLFFALTLSARKYTASEEKTSPVIAGFPLGPGAETDAVGLEEVTES